MGNTMPPVWIELWEKKGDIVGRAELKIDLNQSCAPIWWKLEGKCVKKTIRYSLPQKSEGQGPQRKRKGRSSGWLYC